MGKKGEVRSETTERERDEALLLRGGEKQGRRDGETPLLELRERRGADLEREKEIYSERETAGVWQWGRERESNHFKSER